MPQKNSKEQIETSQNKKIADQHCPAAKVRHIKQQERNMQPWSAAIHLQDKGQ